MNDRSKPEPENTYRGATQTVPINCFERRSPASATLPKARAVGRTLTARVATRSRSDAAAQLVSDPRYERGIQLLEGVVAMLTKMV